MQPFERESGPSSIILLFRGHRNLCSLYGWSVGQSDMVKEGLLSFFSLFPSKGKLKDTEVGQTLMVALFSFPAALFCFHPKICRACLFGGPMSDIMDRM